MKGWIQNGWKGVDGSEGILSTATTVPDIDRHKRSRSPHKSNCTERNARLSVIMDAANLQGATIYSTL